MIKLLASVTDLDEARLAVAGGADIVDLKNPAAGALGALPRETIKTVCGALAGTVPISATVGDLAPRPALISAAVAATAACGVDYVKVGLFPGPGQRDCIEALRPLTAATAVVLVLFADRDPDFSLLAPAAAAGCRGVMLDTAAKNGGGLRDALDLARLRGFVARAKALGLLTGLAGSLGPDDIAPLAGFGPDYLGFRGALCGGGRTGRLQPQRLARLRGLLATVPASASVSAEAGGALSASWS